MFSTVLYTFIFPNNYVFLIVTKGKKDDPLLFSFCSHPDFNYIYLKIHYHQTDEVNGRIMCLGDHRIADRDLMLAGNSVQ